MGAGERAHFLGPPERASPTAASRRPRRCRRSLAAPGTAPTAAPPSSSAIRRVGASWLASAPTPTNTGTTDAVASASSADPPAGRPARTRPANSAIPRTRTPAAIAASAERYVVPRPTGAGEHELHPAGVLLGPQRAHRSQQSEDGGEDRQRPTHTPGRVAGDGEQIVRDPVEQADRLVVSEAAGEREPARQRRVGVAVADRLDIGDDGEQVCEGDRADARVPEGTPRQRACSGEPAPVARCRGARGHDVPSVAAMTVGAVVVVQEYLLQRGLTTGERRDRVPGERCDQRTDAARDLKPQRIRARALHLDARQRRELRRVARERDLHRLRREVAQLLKRSLVDELPVSEDPDAVTERLDLAEDVGGEEDRSGRAAWLLSRVSRKATSISGSSPAVGSSRSSRSGAARERGDQLHLLSVALG